jgi:hypothetical protein
MNDLEVDSDQPVKQLPSRYFRAAARFRALERLAKNEFSDFSEL